MKITLEWLKRHLETEASLEDIVDCLNRIGLEVENVEDRASELAPFTVGYVVKAEQHPNADRLRVCIVETGNGEVQVVCGAPNARTRMKGVFAPAGTHVPGTGLDLKESEIRGVASRGMLCSEREMGLSDEHDGIIELPEDTPVGASFAAISGLDDPVLEIGLTPDRGDCFSVRGIARDLAAAGMGKLKPLDTSPVPGSYKSPLDIELRFDEATRDACPAFIGRYFRGLKNGSSPAWMQQKLRAVGLRPISALVDITNWLTMDIGRPAHIYDADKVKGPIGARISEPGETFDALNDKSYTTDDAMTAIFDGSGMLGLGGVIGGESTGADENTVNGFMEIALFDPIRTAATGRKLELVTDARQRFERGIDNAFATEGMEVATHLVLELCGGEASEVVTAGTVPTEQKTMTVRPSRILNLGGIVIERTRAEAILTDLGFGVEDEGEDTWTVTVPTWRHDMGCEADVIEEVLRINGLDDIPMVSLPRLAPVARPVLSTRQKRVRWSRRMLASRGMNEAVTYSFVSSGHAQMFGGGNQGLTLVNPISSDMDMMRPSILPGLLAAAARNQARGLADFGLFEIGPAYESIEPEGQKTTVAGVRLGHSGSRHWVQKDRRPVDAFDAKADVMAVFEAIGAPVENLQTTADAPDWFHPGRSGVLRLGPKAMAVFGELHPRVVGVLDADGPVAAFELALEDVPEPRSKAIARPKLELSPYQAVTRDFAFVVASNVPAEKLVRAAKGADRALVADVGLFDVFEGERLGTGRKSVAISVILQPTKVTLTDEELEAVSAKIVAAVVKQTGGELRG